jgi:hypothetical protein
VLQLLRKPKGQGHREAAAHTRAGSGAAAVPERLVEEDERGARVSEGERRTGPSWPERQGPIGVVEG